VCTAAECRLGLAGHEVRADPERIDLVVTLLGGGEDKMVVVVLVRKMMLVVIVIIKVIVVVSGGYNHTLLNSRRFVSLISLLATTVIFLKAGIPYVWATSAHLRCTALLKSTRSLQGELSVTTVYNSLLSFK
jgi:hypothetical protein